MKPFPKTEGSSKWIAGIATIGAASSASAALVQIDLVNNSATAGGGVNFNGDFMGDGGVDVTFSSLSVQNSTTAAAASAFLNLPGSTASAYGASSQVNTASGGFLVGKIGFGGNFTGTEGAKGSNLAPGTSASAYLPITFDASNRGGDASQAGFLFISAGGINATRGLTFEAVIWDNSSAAAPSISAVQAGPITSLGSTENGIFSAVPEPSGIALLALGAGGIALRRQRKKATA